MITITTARRLAGLRAEAALVPALRRSAEEEAGARREAEAALARARDAQASAEAAREAILAEVAVGLARLEAAAGSSKEGIEAVHAALALRILRDRIAAVKASGDQAAIDGIHVLDMLIGQDPGPAPVPGAPLPPSRAQLPGPGPGAGSADRIRDYHHPHFAAAERTPWGGTTYWWHAFTGLEPEPQAPEAAWDDDRLTWEDRQEVDLEYEHARIAWAQAKFRREAAPVLRAALSAWQAYLRARSAMDGAFAAFREADHSQWPALFLRLGDAQVEALEAATAWDGTGAGLARLQYEHFREVGCGNGLDLPDVAAAASIDVTSWRIKLDFHDTGQGGGYYGQPLADELREVIGQQKERLREAGELAGAPEREP